MATSATSTMAWDSTPPGLPLLWGTPLVLIMLYYLLRHVLPGMYVMVARDSPPLKQYVVLITMAFFLFLFTSGIRMAQAQECS
ncbi:hypothetical protein [Methanogenium cariaci]|uniref:hypothetical protein n=1 Tax=Methanogenium cariaci TaxID=2197 RepID=UPI001FE0F3AC|nr:hypothetical protein [Methanogenium cariaci]